MERFKAFLRRNGITTSAVRLSDVDRVLDLYDEFRKVQASHARPAENSEILDHIKSTDAQVPHRSEVSNYKWTFIKDVPLSKIQLSPHYEVKFMADDPDLLSKVRQTFEGAEESIKHAQSFIDRGGKFPAVFLYGDEHSQQHDIMDGHHRVLAAALRGDKTIDAYAAK
jgi:hypothetical protein